MIIFVTSIVAAAVYAWSWEVATVLSFVSVFAIVIPAAQLAASLGSGQDIVEKSDEEGTWGRGLGKRDRKTWGDGGDRGRGGGLRRQRELGRERAWERLFRF